MKTEQKGWRPSPPLIVTLTALIVIAGMFLAGWLNARRYLVRARVEIGEPALEIHSAPAPTTKNTINLPDGEVARTAARVREATGLLLGLIVLAVTEQMSNRAPANANELIELMARRSLFPPGIQQTTAGGMLISERATIYVRYYQAPLAIEIISVGNDRADGLALMVRLTTGGDENSAAVMLVAKDDQAALPEPFAPLSQIIAAGWRIEPLRERSFAPEEIEQLNVWARQYATTGK